MDTNIRKRGMVWGGLLILLGGLLLVEQYMDLTVWVWVGILAIAGLVALVVYLTDRSDWWLLLTTYIPWAIAGLIVLLELEVLPDDWVAFYVLTAIALPFLGAYLRDRAQSWALIPAYILLAVGLMIVLTETGILSDLLVPGYVMFAIATPFFVVYARDTKRRWALIPGGVLAIIGVAFFVAEAAVVFIVPAILILVGIGILVRAFTRSDLPEPESISESQETEELPEE